MKKTNSIYLILILFAGMLFQGCQEKPTLVEHYAAFTTPKVVAPATGSFVSPSGTTVALTWESTDADNDAQNWDVYFGPSDEPAKVASGVTAQTYTVTVNKGTKYFWKVIGHDANNIPTSSEVWNFEIVDPQAPLKLKMDWATNVKSAIGLDLPPEQAVDLRLKIRKADKTALATINTATAAEEYSFLPTLPDGVYYISTDVNSTIDAGDFNAVLDIDINLSFSQRGLMDKSVVLNLPKVMTNKFVCSSYTVYLATLQKTGNSYTITQDVVYPSSPLSHVWYGVDKGDSDYPSQVETYLGCSLQVKGLVFGWMSEFWGENIVKGGSASISINTTTGVVDIPLQYYCTTTYNGKVQTPYNIVGTGTYDASGTYPTLTIQYTLIQGTDDWGQWMFDNGYMASNKFEAVLTLDPASAKSLKEMTNVKKLLVKPTR